MLAKGRATASDKVIMTPLDHDRNDGDELSPRDRELMAYLDGELGPEDRARVEASLSADSAVNIDADQRLRDLFDEGAVETPSAHRWKTALNRIELGVAAANPASRASNIWTLAAWFGAAAALLAGVWLAGTHWRDRPPHQQNPDYLGPVVEVFEVVSEDEVVIDDMDPQDVRAIVRGFVPASALDELFGRQPLEVVSAEEVAVITMDGNDTEVLVVGEPPVAGNLVMVRRGDVRVDTILWQGREEMRAYLHEPEGSGMPMLMVPIKTARRD
jgi:hypothetical protein